VGATAETSYRNLLETTASLAAREAGFPARSRKDRITAERPARSRQLLLEW